jgi:hypothetical protein
VRLAGESEGDDLECEGGERRAVDVLDFRQGFANGPSMPISRFRDFETSRLNSAHRGSGGRVFDRA